LKIVQNIKEKLSDDIHFLEMLRGGGASFILKILGMMVGYLLAMFITNNYGAHFFGLYVTALLVLEILGIVSRMGVDTAVVRFFSSYIVNGSSSNVDLLYKKALFILFCGSAFFAILTYSFAYEVSSFLNTSEEYIKLISFVLVPLVMFYLNAQALRGLKKITAFSFLQTVALVLGALILLLVGNAFLTSTDLPIYAYVINVVLMCIVSFAIWAYHKRNIHESVKEEKLIGTKALLAVSFPLLLGQSMMLIMGKVDLLMLANMSSQEEVGIYNIALKISMLAYIGLMAINSIAAPKFSELYASGKMEDLKKIVQQSTKVIFWITLPPVLLFFTFPEYILSFFGEEFKIAVYCLMILSFGKMFSAISGSVGTLLQMAGKQKYFQNVLISAAVLNILLNYLLIPKYGINGAAFASMISNVYWNVLMIIFIKKKFGFYTFYLPFMTR
jgi:O-antigen/teichoic acid export membrane protein